MEKSREYVYYLLRLLSCGCKQWLCLRNDYREVGWKNRRSSSVVERTVLVWYNNPINVKKEKEYVYLQVSKQRSIHNRQTNVRSDGRR